MNKNLFQFRAQCFPLFFLLIFFAACNGQNKTAQPLSEPKDSVSKTGTIPARQPEINLLDNDPYFVETKTINSAFGPQNITRNILQDKNGNIWFASWEGIIRYDGKTFTNFTNKAGLRRYHVFSVLEDRAGNLWFGTIGAGVYRYDGNKFTNFTTKQGLAGNYGLCILEDIAGNIWFGTESGASCFDGTSFRNFTTKEGLVDNDINSIIEDKTGKIWFGTRSGGACFYNGKTFTPFKDEAGLLFYNVRSMIEDKNGNIWIGGGTGLCRFDGKNFTYFTKDFVGYLYEDKKGDILASLGVPKTNMMKLSILKMNSSGNAVFTEIFNKDRQVFGIEEDTAGNIWFGSEKGIYRYDGKTFANFLEK